MDVVRAHTLSNAIIDFEVLIDRADVLASVEQLRVLFSGRNYTLEFFLHVLQDAVYVVDLGSFVLLGAYHPTEAFVDV